MYHGSLEEVTYGSEYEETDELVLLVLDADDFVS